MSTFAALAEPNRRLLLDALRDGARTVNMLVEAIGLSQPAVSKHLRILREAGLVVVRPEGHKEYCEDNSLLRGLERMATEKMDSPPTYSQSDLRQLWDDGFRLVYIETRRTKSASSLFQDFLGTDGIYQQGGGQLAIPIPDPDKEPGDAQ